MKNISKFLLIGATTLAVSTQALADNNANEVVRLNTIAQHFLAEINPLILNQYKIGLLTEKADVTVSVNPGSSRELYDNYFYKKMGVCAVQINFNENGDIPHLGVDGVLNNLTVAKNPLQAKMARQFFALHEHNHCEFFNFKDPIKFTRNQEKNTYVLSGLKDLSKINLASSYTDTVNESYADVSASISILIEYGLNNQDALQLLDSIKTQRKDNYIQKEMDSHFSHFAMEELLNPINLNRLSKMTQSQEVREFALELANKGAAKSFYAKPQMKDATFHDKTLFASVAAEVGILEVQKINPNQPLPFGFEKLNKYNMNNLVTFMAQKVYSEPEVQRKLYSLRNTENQMESSLQFVYNYLNANTQRYSYEINLYRQTMNELNTHIEASVKGDIIATNFIPEDYSTKAVSNNVNKLRQEYAIKNGIKNKPF